MIISYSGFSSRDCTVGSRAGRPEKSRSDLHQDYPCPFWSATVFLEHLVKVERWNQVVGKNVGSVFEELGRPKLFKWWDYVRVIANKYNFSKIEGTNATPYEVRCILRHLFNTSSSTLFS